MPIVEIDLQGVIADGMRRLRAEFGLEHGKRRRTHERRRAVRIFLFQALIIDSLLFFFPSLVVTHGAGTLLPEISEIVVAGVAVRPDDVDTASRGHMHLYAGGLSSFIERYRHGMAIFVTTRIWNVSVEPAFRRALYISLNCPPEGGRYNSKLSYRKRDAREPSMFKFDAPVRKVTDRLRVRNN